jgi:hypothetical protein
MTNNLKGGKADGMTLEDIARKHNVFIGTIKKQFEMGVKIEMEEHTKSRTNGEEIAMDHLVEDPEYYTHLKAMEKKTETKEQTMADASGSFEAPLTTTVLKRDIYKLSEQMDAGVSAGAMYDGPIGTAGASSPMDKRKKRRKDPLELDEKGGTASITAASTKDMISTKKGFPRFGGPKAKFVQIDAKCKKFPYCNQGDSGKKFKFISEVDGMKEAMESAAKKYGITVEEVKKIVIKEALPVGMLDDPGNKKAMKSWVDKSEKTIYHISTKHPIDIKTDDEIEMAKLKIIFYKHDIKFQEHVIKR